MLTNYKCKFSFYNPIFCDRYVRILESLSPIDFFRPYNVCVPIMKVNKLATVRPTKSDSDVNFSLQLLSKTLTCTSQLRLRESIGLLCINPIICIGLIHK